MLRLLTVRTAATVLLVGLALPGDAQSPTTFPAETQVVHLEVAVTDRRGQPVRDLGPDDFAVYEDGRPVSVVAFRSGRRALAPGPAQQAPSPAQVLPTRAAAPDAPLTFVVYVDNWNLTPADRARVLPRLASFLKGQLARGGTRALVISAGQETHLLSPLTPEVDTVEAALRSAQGEPAHGHVTRSDERQAIDTVKKLLEGGAFGCEDLSLLQAPIHSQAEARSRDLERTLARLDAVVQALGTLPGSKALFYVSSGLEQRPAIDLFYQLGDICPTALQRDFSALLAPMAEYDLSRAFGALAGRANSARVTFYPIDASGLRASQGDASEANRRFVPSPKTDMMRAQNLKAGQWILADRTGGSAVFNANAPQKPLQELADQIRDEYALGFTPDHKPEGRVHSFHVELKRKGLRVRHTPSYFHGERAEPGASRTLAALLVGLEEDTLGAAISVDPLEAPDQGAKTEPTAHVRIAVPLARLSAVENEAGRHARLRVVIAIWKAGASAKEEPFEVREKLIDVPLPPASSLSGSDPGRREFVVDVPLSTGHREVALGVHDAFSQLVTYRRLSVGF